MQVLSFSPSGAERRAPCVFYCVNEYQATFDAINTPNFVYLFRLVPRRRSTTKGLGLAAVAA
jgi:hypothetical protein